MFYYLLHNINILILIPPHENLNQSVKIQVEDDWVWLIT